MQFDDDRYRLHVEINTKGCEVPADELARMQQSLEQLGEAIQGFPRAELFFTIVRHPRSEAVNVEARMKLPGRTLFTADRDDYLDSAFQRCLDKLIRKTAEYKANPDRQALERARGRLDLDRDLVAPEDPAAGPLGEAVRAGDYRAFRSALAGYEEWLRLRVGRWVQRYPEAEAKVGGELLLGDLVEEVYLNAFEGFARRPTGVGLWRWLEGLLDPSLRALLRHPAEERENASLARTLRSTPLTGREGRV
jgi:hypothetical protein